MIKSFGVTVLLLFIHHTSVVLLVQSQPFSKSGAVRPQQQQNYDLDEDSCSTARSYSAIYHECDVLFFYLGGFAWSKIQPPGEICNANEYTIARHEKAYVQKWPDACVAVEERCYAFNKDYDHLYSSGSTTSKRVLDWLPVEMEVPPAATHVSVSCELDYNIAVEGKQEPSYVPPPYVPPEERKGKRRRRQRRQTGSHKFLWFTAAMIGIALFVRQNGYDNTIQMLTGRGGFSSSSSFISTAVPPGGRYEIAATGDLGMNDMVEMSTGLTGQPPRMQPQQPQQQQQHW